MLCNILEFPWFKGHATSHMLCFGHSTQGERDTAY